VINALLATRYAWIWNFKLEIWMYTLFVWGFISHDCNTMKLLRLDVCIEVNIQYPIYWYCEWTPIFPFGCVRYPNLD
jgi:hypothetical protein